MPYRKFQLIFISTAGVTLQPTAHQSRKTSVASMHCATVLAVDHLLWSIYGSYFTATDLPPEWSGWASHNSDSPPPSQHEHPLPRHEIDLGLQALC